MKPVTQTRTGVPQGNCTEACIASVLEVPLEEVPDLYDATTDTGHDPERWTQLRQWLRERGFLWMFADFKARDLPLRFVDHWQFAPDDFLTQIDWDTSHYFFCGPNPDGLPHCVVAQGGQVVWDPNPFRRGITAVDGLVYLTPLAILPPEMHDWPAIQLFLDGPPPDEPPQP